MANPEHIEIVKAGKPALTSWRAAQREKHRGSEEELSGAMRLDLSGADLSGDMFGSLCLDNCDLKGANLHASEFYDCTLIGANLEGANLKDTFVAGGTFAWAILDACDLTNAFFVDTMFWFAKLRKANLTNAFICNSCLTSADLEEAVLDGILIYGSSTDEWKIRNVRCTHFFLPSAELVDSQEPILLHADGMVRGKRIPESGFLSPHEFEDRFRMRPTVEFMFDREMSALGPAILALAIDEANSKNQAAGMRLLEISGRGGIPRAVIEIAEKMSKQEALALVSACYHQKIGQMQEEIEGLRQDKRSLLQIASKKMLLPWLAGATSFVCIADLAMKHEVDAQALRKRLERLRAKHPLDPDLFVESQNRGTRKAQYLYNEVRVLPTIESLKKKKASVKRPSAKK